MKKNNTLLSNNGPVVMTIAGSDSGAGAGIQADLKTISALDGYGTTVITALTAQNTMGVDGIFAVPIDFIEKQFLSITTDFDVNAVKTGMLHNNEVVNCVANLFISSKIDYLVVDPVMIATSGDKLITEETIDCLIKKLFPLATIITPNLKEAELILNIKINSIDEMINASKYLLEFGSEAVLLKGGHFNETNDNTKKIYDIFYSKKNVSPLVYTKPKINTKNLHGTGCTLSAALATFLSKEIGIWNSFLQTEKYIYQAIKKGMKFNVGKGNGPLWHF